MARITNEEESEGKYTLERLRVRRPEALEEIVALVAAGLSGRRIARLVKVHEATVAQVISQEPRAIEAVRSKLGPKILTAVALQLDRLVDDPECVPRNMIGLTLAQLLDKYQLLTGGATARVEVMEKPMDPHRAFNELLEDLPQADAHVVGSTTGLSGGKSEAIGDASDGGGGDLGDASSEVEAVALPDDEEGATRTATQTDGGAGGAPRARGGRPNQTGPGDQKNF